MDYQTLINKNLTKAFNMLKSFTVEVILTKKSAETYSFSSMTSATTDAAPITTRAVILGKVKTSNTSNTLKQQLLLNTQPIGDLSLYDKITVNGVIWSIGPSIDNSGYITLIELFREV
jgi:prephenate dehydratase